MATFTASYSGYARFTIPKEVKAYLLSKEEVENIANSEKPGYWWIKHMMFRYIDETGEVCAIESDYDAELDCKWPDNVSIESIDEDEWENDDLCLELNYGNCANDGRHPKTSDDDWALFQRAMKEDYSEELYFTLRHRLDARKREEVEAAHQEALALAKKNPITIEVETEAEAKRVMDGLKELESVFSLEVKPVVVCLGAKREADEAKTNEAAQAEWKEWLSKPSEKKEFATFEEAMAELQSIHSKHNAAMKAEWIKKGITYHCSLCDEDKPGYGNNPYPLAGESCCDACNITKVIPARMGGFK
jgi:hypothetical protein